MTNTQTNPCLPAAPRSGKSSILHSAYCTMRHSAFRILHSAFLIAVLAAMTASAVSYQVTTITGSSGTYSVGQTIKINVFFGETIVSVSGGAPTLSLVNFLNTTTATAQYKQLVTDGNKKGMQFEYAVQPGDFSTGIGVSGFDVGGATILGADPDEPDTVTAATIDASTEIFAGETITIETMRFQATGTRTSGATNYMGSTLPVTIDLGGQITAEQSFEVSFSQANKVSSEDFAVSGGVTTFTIPANSSSETCTLNLDAPTSGDMTVTFHPANYTGTDGDLVLTLKINGYEATFTESGTKTWSTTGFKGNTLDVGITLDREAAVEQKFDISATPTGKASFTTPFTIPSGSMSGTCSLQLTASTDDPVTVTFHPQAYGTDTAGDLTLTLSIVQADKPRIVAIRSTSENSEFGVGESIVLEVAFSGPIDEERFSGTPYIELNVDNSSSTPAAKKGRAYYDSDYGIVDGTNMYFVYEVKPGDFTEELDCVRQGFKLNSSTIYVNGTRVTGTMTQNMPYGNAEGSLKNNADISIRTITLVNEADATLSGKEGEDPPLTVDVTRNGSTYSDDTTCPAQAFTLIVTPEADKDKIKLPTSFTIPAGADSATLTIELVEKTEGSPLTLTLRPVGQTGKAYATGAGDIELSITIEQGDKPKVKFASTPSVREGGADDNVYNGMVELPIQLDFVPKNVEFEFSSPNEGTLIRFANANPTLSWTKGNPGIQTLSVYPLDDGQVTITATPINNTSYEASTLTFNIINRDPKITTPVPHEDGSPFGPVGQGTPYTLYWSGKDVTADMSDLHVEINWGDGTSDSIPAPAADGSKEHIFKREGQLTIKLRMLDGDGGSAEVEIPIQVDPPIKVLAKEYREGGNNYKSLQGLGKGEIRDATSNAVEEVVNYDYDWLLKYDPLMNTAILRATPQRFQSGKWKNSYGESGTFWFDSFFHVWYGEEEVFRSAKNLVPMPRENSNAQSASIKLKDGEDPLDPEVGGVFAREHFPEDGCPDIDYDELPDGWEAKVWPGGGDEEGESSIPFETTVAPYGRDDNPDLDFFPACVSGIDGTTGNFILHTDPGSRSDFTPVGTPFINVYEVRGTHRGLNMDPAWAPAGAAEAVEPQDEPHCGSYDENWDFSDNGSANPFFPWFGTDPTKPDTDEDKLTDGYEYFFWRMAILQPDDLALIAERYDPTMVIEGQPIDAKEVEAHFNPCVATDHLAGDFDGDGLSDFEEFLLGTNPINWDTDRDQMNDGWEVMWGLNPKDYRDWKENPDGDYMANDANDHFHADVYVEYGFDPRTAWNATYIERNRGLALPAPNTAPFSNYHEHYLARWCIDHGFAPVPEEGERGEVIPLSWDFMTQPVPSGWLHFYNPDPYWTGPRKVPNYELAPGEVGEGASGTSYVVPVGDLGYLVEAIEITTHGCDSDGDGIPDGWELYLCSSDGESRDGLWPISEPLVRESAKDADGDFDGDALSNVAEFRSVESCDYYASFCTNGVFNFTGNWYNKWWPTDIFNSDTDSDGLPDGFEGDSTFTYQVSYAYSAENPSVNAWIAAQVCDAEQNLTFGETTMLRGHVPGGGLNPCAVDTDMDYIPDYWEWQYPGFYRDPDWAGGFCNQPGTECGIVLQNGGGVIELFGGGMDGTYFDSRSGYDECSHKPNRNFDYDGDGLENYQEYWINGVRHFQYDKWEPDLGYGGYDIQEIFATGRFSETTAPAKSFKTWNPDPNELPEDPRNPQTAGVSELFMKWDWSVWADDWQNEGLKAPSGLYPPFRYMPPEPRPLVLMYASTDPRLADSDADTMDDFYEMFHGLNPILSDVADYCGLDHPEDESYDFRKFPWMAGMPNADPDGDDIPNWEEALSPDQPAPANHNTDPSPLWFTDMSYANSFVNLYYDWGSAANFWTVEGLLFPYEYYPEPGAMFPGLMDPRPHYVFDFECNEGFDTDNDNISDRYETAGSAGGVTDAQNPDRPIGRKALYLDGNAAARTRSICAFGPNALRSWTIEAWVMPETPATGNMQVILERPVIWDESNAEEETQGFIRRTFRLGLDGRGIPFVEFNNGGKENVITEYAKAPEGDALLEGKWYHLAATMDGFQKKLTLYINGRRVASQATTTIPYTGFTDTALNAVGSQEYHQPRWSPIVIGASDSNPVGQVDGSLEYYNGSVSPLMNGQPRLGDFFRGYVDEVRIWDGARPGGEDAGDQRVAFWRWPTIKDDYEALKRYGMDETIKAREDGAQYLARIVDYRAGILDAKRQNSAAANFITPPAASTNGTAAATNVTLAASSPITPEGLTFDEYRVEASTYILMTGGEDTVCRIPPHLLCVYSFDTLPDPDLEPEIVAQFRNHTKIRPDDYNENGAPWWAGADDRSTVYYSAEVGYTFPQYIQNFVAWQPLGIVIREENGAMDEEYSEITGGTRGLPLFVYQPDHVVNSKYWTRYTKGGKALSELESYVDYGVDAVNTFPNSANPYGYRYETGIHVSEENHPITMAQEAYDPEYAVLFNDMLPLRNARAVSGTSIQLWDDPTGDHVGVNNDSDGDGLPDWWEIENGTDPHNADQNGNGISDEMDDFDGDGLTNWYEYLAGTDPNDSTTDGLQFDADADADGDGLTNLQEQDFFTHPLHPDSDDDGWVDGYEVTYGSNPLDSLDPYRPRALKVDADGFAFAKAARYQTDGSFTLAASAYPVAYPESDVADIVSYKIGEDVWNFFLRLDPDGIVSAGFTRRDGSGEFALAAPTFRALPTNAWTQIEFAYDYAAQMATLSFNGEPVASQPVSAKQATYTDRILQPVVIGAGFSGYIRNVLMSVPGERGPRMDIRFDDGTAYNPASGLDTYGVPLGDELGGQAEDFAIATTNVPYGSVEYRLLTETAATFDGNASFVLLDENLVPIEDEGAFDNLDTDGDGLPDWWEIENGLNPYNADTDGDGVTDDLEDPDLDGLKNRFEYLAGTDPNNAKTDGSTLDGEADGDGDNLPNRLEQLYGTDPGNPDTDDDGISDGDEVFGNGFGYFTLPTSALSPARQGILFANGTAAAFTNDSVLAALRITKSWTIEAWVKGTSSSAMSGVIVRRGVADGAINYELGLEGGKPYARIAGVYDGAVDADLSVKAIADFAVDSSIWSHVAAVWSDDTRTLAVYVDGVLAANVYKREIDLGVFAQDGLAPVTVGDGLRGYLDEVRIWDIARSGVSIASTAFQTFEHVSTQPLVELRFDDFGVTAENFGFVGGFLAGGDMMDGSVKPRLSPIAVDEFVDSDGDHIPDFWEIAIFGSVMACDPAGDDDGDGLSNLYEYYAHTYPLTKYTGDSAYGSGENASIDSDAQRDADGDGLSNLAEQNLGTRPDLADTDDDGWSDYEEVNGTTLGRSQVGVSDPLNSLSPVIPRAAKFTGTGVITVPQRNGQSLASWTLAAWVRPAANANGTVAARVFGDGSANYAIGVEKVSGVLTPYASFTAELPDNRLAEVRAGVDQAPTFRDDNPAWLTLKPDKWTHIAATYTGTNTVGTVTNGLLTLYIDGTAVAWRQDALMNPFVGAGNGTPLGGELRVGENFTGLIDDVRVVTHAVTADDIVSIMGGGPIAAPQAETSRAKTKEAFAKKANAIAGDYIVRFRDGVTRPASTATVAALGGNVRQTYSIINAAHVTVPQGADEEAFVASLRNDPSVLYVEPNLKRQLFKAPNDTDYAKLWGLHNDGQTGGKAGCDIDAETAWEYTTGSREIVVAVIDTGVDYTHPDLANNMWQNPGEIPDNGVDDDGNGFVDDVYGWDFANGDADPMDDHSHGTHCSGTIGGVGNNGQGVAGVNWNVKIMALKAGTADGGLTTAAIVGAIDYSIQMGARLSSNSYGGYGFSQAEYDAVKAAGEAGMLFIAAAGNEANDNDGAYQAYPASFDLDCVIAVAATDSRDDIAYFSNYGATSVDLGAPGVDIWSTIPVSMGSYGNMSGTSMATPHVAGAAALIFAADPTLTASAVKGLLLEYADPVDALAGKCVSGGRLNVGAIIPVVFNPGGDLPIPVSARGLCTHLRFDDGGATVHDFARGQNAFRVDAYAGRLEGGVTLVTDADEDLDLIRFFADSDDDSLPDWWEEMVGFSPLTALSGGRNGDDDGDGLSNFYEFRASLALFAQGLRGLDPFNPDTDNNGISDYDEDSDADDLSNGEEQDIYISDPGMADSDDDGEIDSGELAYGYDPIDSAKPYVSRALDFTGASGDSNTVVVKDKVNGVFTERFSSEEWTVEAWVNPASASLSGEYALVSRALFATGALNYEIGLRNGKPYARYTAHGGTDMIEVVAGSAIAASAWTHIAARFDADQASATSGTLTLFVNGEPVAMRDGGTIPATGPGDLVFGSSGFKGQMFGIRVWKIPQTDASIRGMMKSELLGGRIEGMSGVLTVNGNGFLKESATTLKADGDPIDVLEDTWTVECWLKTTGNSGIVMARRNSSRETTEDFNYCIQMNDNGSLRGRFAIWFEYIAEYDEDGNPKRYEIAYDYVVNDLIGEMRVNDGDWHHVAYVRSPTQCKLYVDGILDATQAALYVPAGYDIVDAGVRAHAGPVVIGEHFVGSIDETRIWNRDLSTAEIGLYSHQNLAGSEIGLISYFNFDFENEEDFVMEHAIVRDTENEKGIFIRTLREEAFVDTDTKGPENFRNSPIRSLQNLSLSGAFFGRDGGETIEDRTNPMAYEDFAGVKYAGILGSGVRFGSQNPVSWTSTADSDGDGLPDVWEVANGLDPYNSDQDGNGVPDGFDDFDHDGLRNEAEYRAGLDPWNPNTDNKGPLDFYDKPASSDSLSLSYGWLYTDTDYVPDSYEVEWEDIFASPFRYDEHEDRDLDGWDNWSEALSGTALAYSEYNEPASAEESGEEASAGVVKAANFPLPNLMVTLDYNGAAIAGSKLVIYAYSHEDMNGWPDAVFVKDISSVAIDTWPVTVPIGGDDLVYGHLRQGRNWFFAWMDGTGSDGTSAGSVTLPTWSENEPAAIADNQLDGIDIGFDLNEVAFHLTDKAESSARFSWEGKTPAGDDVEVVINYSGNEVFRRIIQWPRTWLHEGDIISWNIATSGLTGTGRKDFGLGALCSEVRASDELPRGFIVRITPQREYEGLHWSTEDFYTVTNWMHTASAVAKPVIYGPRSYEVVYGARPEFRFSLDPEYTEFQFTLTRTTDDKKIFNYRVLAPGRFHNDATGKRDLVIWKFPYSIGERITASGYTFGDDTAYTWEVVGYSPALRTASSAQQSGAANFKTASWSSSDANGLYASGGKGRITVKVDYPSRIALTAGRREGLTEPFIRIQAFRSKSFNGVPDVSLQKSSEGTFTLNGLEDGESYYLRAYVEQDNDQDRDNWESWGYYRAGNGAANPFVPVAVKATRQDNSSIYSITIQDCDTDNDLLPDCYEYAKTGYGASPNMGVSDHAPSVKGLVAYASRTPLALAAATATSDYDGDGLNDYEDEDPADPDPDGDGINDGLERALGFDANTPQTLKITSVAFDDAGNPVLDWTWEEKAATRGPATTRRATLKGGAETMGRKLAYVVQGKVALTDPEWKTVRMVYTDEIDGEAVVTEEGASPDVDVKALRFFRVKVGAE